MQEHTYRNRWVHRFSQHATPASDTFFLPRVYSTANNTISLETANNANAHRFESPTVRLHCSYSKQQLLQWALGMSGLRFIFALRPDPFKYAAALQKLHVVGIVPMATRSCRTHSAELDNSCFEPCRTHRESSVSILMRGAGPKHIVKCVWTILSILISSFE
jgi:hypothetical protein